MPLGDPRPAPEEPGRVVLYLLDASLTLKAAHLAVQYRRNHASPGRSRIGKGVVHREEIGGHVFKFVAWGDVGRVFVRQLPPHMDHIATENDRAR